MTADIHWILSSRFDGHTVSPGVQLPIASERLLIIPAEGSFVKKLFGNVWKCLEMISLNPLLSPIHETDWQANSGLLPYPKRVKRNLNQVLKEKVRVTNNLVLFFKTPSLAFNLRILENLSMRLCHITCVITCITYNV